MADTYKVRRRTADGRSTILFDGNEDDARTHVQNNFPRPHVEPGGTPDRLRGDVQLLHPDGTVQEFHGDAGWVSIKDDEVVDDFDDFNVDDDDDDDDLEEV